MTAKRTMSRLLLLLGMCTSACGTPDTSSESTAGHSVTDSAGVRIVLSTSAAWGPEPAHLDSVPLVQIASADSGPNQFAFVFQGVLLPDGRMAVVEQAANEVRVFSANGTHLQTLGGRGGGPGEFESLSGLFPYTNDSLLTFDQMLRRATVLLLNGDAVRVVPSPIAKNLTTFGRLNGAQLLLHNLGGSYRPGVPPGLQWDTTDIVRFDVADGSAQVIARLPSRLQFVEPDGNAGQIAPPQSAVYASSERGFYWATSERYDIRFYSGSGALQQILRRPVEPTPVTPDMTEQWIEANLKPVRRDQGEAAVDARRQQLAAGERGTHVPLFQEAFVDRDQRLWVGASSWPGLSFSPPPSWSLFDADGVWLGDLVVPPGFRPLDSRGDRVLGVWADEDDVPHVQVRRLVQP